MRMRLIISSNGVRFRDLTGLGFLEKQEDGLEIEIIRYLPEVKILSSRNKPLGRMLMELGLEPSPDKSWTKTPESYIT